MRLGIIGTRGIPNRYGGFEQFASFVAPALAERGHEVAVYNPSSHPFREREWRGVKIIPKYDPGKRVGSAGQFIYDLNCILDSRKRSFDVLLQLGYTSSSIWNFLLSRNALVITNMDGMEWKRSKYTGAVKQFLQYAEKLAVKASDVLIADSEGIGKYLESKYQRKVRRIAYGATLFNQPDPTVLARYRLGEFGYHLSIARMEPENNTEMIIQGWLNANTPVPLVIVGDHTNRFGRYLYRTYSRPGILFTGGIYDATLLNNLRYFSRIYFHGHSVGGTNPSLLEAMAAGCLIASHHNIFNKTVLGPDAFYFESDKDISFLMNERFRKKDFETFIQHNRQKISEIYSWRSVVDQVEECLYI